MENRFLKWLSSETQSVYWHDSAIRAEQLEGFSNGAVGMTTNPFLVKEALALDGFPVGGVRLPLVDATPEQSERLAAIMREVGVL